jgi:hypothetical protein
MKPEVAPPGKYTLEFPAEAVQTASLRPVQY